MRNASGLGTARVLAWVGCAAAWVLSLGLPWTTRGPFSQSSFADAIALVRGGQLDDAVPAIAPGLALAGPVVGVVLLTLSGLGGRGAAWARSGLGLIGSTVALVAAATVPGPSAGLGPGGLVAVGGVVLAGVAVALEVVLEVVLDGPRKVVGRTTTPARPWILVGFALGALAAGQVVWLGTQHEVGADGPEEAARQLVAAVVAQDPIGALAVLDPDEATTVVATFLRLRDRLGVTDQLADLVDIDVADLEVVVEDAGDRARVRLAAGTYRVVLSLDRLPGLFGIVGALLPDVWSGDFSEPPTGPLALFLDDTVAISTVLVDGRWHVTGVGTALDTIGDTLGGAILGG